MQAAVHESKPGAPRLLLAALLSADTTDERWLRRTISEELHAIEEVLSLAQREAGAALLLLDEANGSQSLLEEAQGKASAAERLGLSRLAAFWQRLSWMLAPPERAALATLEPRRDCERIFHFVAREFRTELKVFAVLHEMRAAVSLPLASFFLSTGEFSTRGVKRIVDTVLLVCNALEWGFDSARGQYCLQRIADIHARYAIPSAAFKFVLCGIMFIPWEFNQRFGWRPMSDTERLGWFHAFVKLGRGMRLEDLSDDFDEMYAWYREVSASNARYAPNKQRLVHDILGQVLERYPKQVRAVIASAFVAGMDDAYLTATQLPRAPHQVEQGLKRLFRLAGNAAQAAPPSGYWLQSLLKSSVYPQGYALSELGVGPRTGPPLFQGGLESLPVMSRAELAKRVNSGEILLVIDGAVYDLTEFSQLHPGSAAILERHAGQDATLAFHSAPHAFATRGFKENYRIARWEPQSTDAPSSDAGPTKVPSNGAVPTSDAVPTNTAVPSVSQLAVRRSKWLPVPDGAESLHDWALRLLPIVNHRSRDPLTLDEAVDQLQRLLPS